jgi:hypothetical protein
VRDKEGLLTARAKDEVQRYLVQHERGEILLERGVGRGRGERKDTSVKALQVRSCLFKSDRV